MDEVSVVNNVGEKEEEEEIIEEEEEEEYKTELTEKFTKLFDELEDCDGNEQRQNIEEMNGLMDKMDEEELRSVFTIENFDKIDKMVEEKKMRMENAILLMKRIGCWIELKGLWRYPFENSLLSKRIEKMMIVDTENKREEKDEKLLTDVCECYSMILDDMIPGNLLVICLPFLLKAASNKEENEEAKEEVEMALLALNSIGRYEKVSEEVYVMEFKEIIKYHQEHHNLTRLAYQSAWECLLNRFQKDKSLEEVIVNELHFAREAIKELDGLTRNVNWKKKKEGEEKGKETKAHTIIRIWIDIIIEIFSQCKLRNEEFVGLINSIVGLYRAAKDSHREICRRCIYSLRIAARSEHVKNDDLLEGGAIDTFFEELYQPTLEDGNVCNCLDTVYAISGRLEGKTDDEMEEAKRKEMNRKVFEKMEEEGYEDTITSFHEMLTFLELKFECSI
ncbi:uncharacterized protein MONOS_2544 [Monocercomonoides exilis]|uniref:uncharacterized protein n=1 Tax=Monocercomonoides exilis TaxID=2049356 RepID=UPI00355ACD91|nr:hypothetical protein MONOS_2544 [Monocercomonoides exilis]|eukprot:MONOS_2544.1-p1 / transcript=MONOS_2544.1 / gene=MONOS_2544 / organism=Monocercomonoides_exilis_PA203 / gene_product=unspecified product / transcript_product=unspecified product / location=Mono_scaffold00053:54210-55698(+) / protein_length=449 / sequence_SO=supercontig / SO=protein_coding / is_pseudo=false